MTGTDRVDAVIVGAGAAGGAAAWRLATAGWRVVCVEQGGWDDRTAAASESLDWELARQRGRHPNPNLRRGPADYPIDDLDTPIRPLLYNGVGGSLIHWGAHFPRLHPSDFRVRSLDGVGVDWPIGYDDLDPYFELNDSMMGVAGVNGDPANPPRGPRQTRPLPLGRGGERLAKAFDELGWAWWPADAAINSEPYGQDRLACNMCGPCDLGCPRGARASSDITYWPEAIAAGAELRTHCRVSTVTVDERGRATGVAYFDADGVERHQAADVVVMAANGIGTARLLLNSTSPAHPHGLANTSDQVGRNLMHHPIGMVTGVFDEELEGFKGPFAVSIVSQEFYETDPSRGFPRGYMMQYCRSDGPLGTALGGYLAPVPWGPDHHRVLAQRLGHTASVTVTTEDLPDPDNRVTLHPTLTDSSGIPAPKLTYTLSPVAERTIAHGIVNATTLMRTAGAREVVPLPLISGAGFHLLGTARMGDDPATSVVNGDCRAHDVDNLFVIDGSVFATCGAVNPTSTIMAVALRAADRMIGRGAPLPVAAARGAS
ncbi:MAG TPA: GMC family oxidoreductase [Mycobacteriales bacterium]|nr:GMC family oxidoreductase [Mycobacteriales bacterium]